MNRLPYIYVHADDYGMTPTTCQRIQNCCKQGCLNSISIMPNGCLESENELETISELPCAIHLNLVEGKGLVSADQIDLLVRSDGYLKNSFFQLFLLSISPKKKKLEQQLYLELKAQIFSTMKLLPKGYPIFLDSHQHTHMIPLVFKTILRIIKEEDLPVQYLRISAEPIIPFLLEPSLYSTYRPVNIIKNLVLNFLWLFDRKQFQMSGIHSALFCGIIFSGNMDEYRVMKIFPHFYRRAKKLGCDLEFLFHPGYVKPGDKFMDPYKKSFHQFYLSKGRKIENETLCSKDWCRLIKEKNAMAVPLESFNKKVRNKEVVYE
ncbi:MAG: ChbG/HpnK family deacetylase [Lachnospiraceae bacterium]|nr:ChbG/HpnK family deacetylase [Lachnospiraceae bacterium]